jgi:hypothetical protein
MCQASRVDVLVADDAGAAQLAALTERVGAGVAAIAAIAAIAGERLPSYMRPKQYRRVDKLDRQRCDHVQPDPNTARPWSSGTAVWRGSTSKAETYTC